MYAAMDIFLQSLQEVELCSSFYDDCSNGGNVKVCLLQSKLYWDFFHVASVTIF